MQSQEDDLNELLISNSKFKHKGGLKIFNKIPQAHMLEIIVKQKNFKHNEKEKCELFERSQKVLNYYGAT